MKMEVLIQKLYQEYGYYEGMKMSRKEFDDAVAAENLDKYTHIAFDPEERLIEDMVALVHQGGKYTVLSTGERATTAMKDFIEMESALAYMMYVLRVKKAVMSRYEK